MSPIEALVEKLTPRQRELLEELLASRRNASVGREPIAVIGLGCRFPGGCDDPEAFFRFLLEGGDAVTEIPESRFRVDAFYDPEPQKPGKMNTRWGGFLDDVESFDPRFFGISPREAAEMDPQQRLLLEVAYDALDDAGLPRRSISGSALGVFVGTHSNDYSWIRFADPTEVASYLSTGTAHSIVANRLSFLLDVRGPSLSVDTACSSSLVGIHLACRSLHERDCDVAIAAGVNVILSPHWGVAVSQLGMLSPDGRCRAFDHRANGFVRSEGCGAVVLKRLSDARAARDRIYALVRGSFVNQDGRTNGLTAPNGLAQRAVVRGALADAGVEAGSIGYVETHGTGTALGDPIEVEALGEALARDGVDAPLRVLGSVKSNLGHLEAAAGVAGFVKAVLALEREVIPPQIHFERPNPHIDLERGAFEVPTKSVAWPRASASPRRAGVSSFGFGGTNAHVILEEAPAAEEDGGNGERSGHLLVMSAKSEGSLRDLSGRYVAFLKRSTSALEAICSTASLRRDHHVHRLAVAGRDREDLVSKLEAFRDGLAPEGLTASAASSDEAPVFVFSGQGPQWWAMGRELLAAESVFRRAIEVCDAILARRARWSLLDELAAPEGSSRLNETEIAQPALFSLQVALVALLRHWGVDPCALIGHSVGEVAAAHVASALTLEGALEVAFERGRLMQAASGGAMLSVELPPEGCPSFLHEGVEIAAVNGPRATVVSGSRDAIDELARMLAERGVATRPLPVGYAFHSEQMEPARRELSETLAGLAHRDATKPVFSTVTGARYEGPFDASYWARNVRETVRFREAVEAAIDSGHRLFIEIGPHPVLGGNLWDCLESRGVEGRVLPTLRRGRRESQALLETVGALHAWGAPIRFEEIYAACPPVSLPGYPYTRERFPVLPSGRARTSGSGGHPLLGARADLAVPVFEARLAPDQPKLLGDHRWNGRALFPAAFYLEMALASIERPSPGDVVTVERLAIDEPLFFDDGEERRVQLAAMEGTSFRVFSSSADAIWTLHASGTVRCRTQSSQESPAPFDVRAFESHGEPLSVDAHYERAERHGVQFGAGFRTLSSIHRKGDEVVARVAISNDADSDGETYRMHPALLDAGIQALHALLDEDVLYLPVAVERFVWREARARVAFTRGVLRGGAATDLSTFDVFFLDADGRSVAEAFGLKMKRADASESAPLYALRWRAVSLDDPTEAEAQVSWLLVARGAPALERLLNEQGHSVRVVEPEALATTLAERTPSRLGVVDLASLDAASPAAAAFETVTALLRHRSGLPTRLWIASRGAQAVSGVAARALSPFQAALWGLGATLALEHPELRAVLVDLDPEAAAAGEAAAEAEATAFGRALAWGWDESRLAIRNGGVYQARLERADPPKLPETYRLDDGGASRGDLAALRFVAASRSLPAEDEVTVEVRATGLNFRDVLGALDLYPGTSSAPGNECAGIVTAVGAKVKDLVPGDRVVAALVPGSFASHVNAPRSHVIRLADTVSFREGAAIPIAFLTARYGLETRAGLREGERVLVHAGAGGVGMAAIQIAKRLGARVLATAGSEEKRAHLRAMGVELVSDSRTLDFADAVRTATCGEGVEVVLNALSGPFIPESLDLLGRGGRFIEIGKRDIWSADEVAARRADVRYEVFDLEEVYRREPEAMQALLLDTFEQVRKGHLFLPTRAFPTHEVAKAFRFMAEAKHIGKIVVERRGAALDPAASYLVTGGLGALGLHVARWLAKAGARRLVLAGRRPPDARAARAIAELEAEGVSVFCARCDVSREADVRALFVAEAGAPIRGVVHAAGALNDGLLGRQALEAFLAPFSAKAVGAANLDRVTRELGLELDFFVLFSSMASVLGSVGQGGYAAANAFLDGLARNRRLSGLEGSSLSWGPWAGDGMASSEEADSRYRARGIRKLPAPAARRTFERAIAGELEPHVLCLPVDWSRFVAELPDGESFYRDLASKPVAEREAEPARFVDRVRGASIKKARELVASRVRAHVGAVLGVTAEGSIDPELGFRDQGLDSLMAVEVRNRLRLDFEGVALPTTLCFDFPTVTALTALLIREIRNESPTGEAGAGSLERSIASLTEDEAEALLLEELEGRRSSR